MPAAASPEPFRFDDGAAYERGMGVWSRLVGEAFLTWLAPPPAARWVDIGCGNGAFTELILARTAPTQVDGVDPSAGQLDFARARKGAAGAVFQQASADPLPFADDAFDVAVMALVIFFVPDPARALAEMVRVTRPGGLVTAYAWEFPAGFPLRPIQDALRATGFNPPLPPHASIARTDNLRAAWEAAGLVELRRTAITVTRRFEDFEDFWTAMIGLGTTRATIDAMTPADRAAFRDRVRARLPASDGPVAYEGHANAIVGRVRK